MSAPARSTRPRRVSTAGPQPINVDAASTPRVEASTPSAQGGGVSLPPHPINSNGPMTVADCEALAAQLLDTAATPRRRLEIANELRDSAECTREFVFFEKYLGVFIPMLVTVLGDEKTISFTRDSTEHRYRHTLLAFLQRLPHSEPFRQHEAAIMTLMIKLLKMENEENALSCIKIMIDGIRNHKEQAEPFVKPFLELVKQMYANTKTVVEKEFGTPGVRARAEPSPTPTSGTPRSPATSTTPNPTGTDMGVSFGLSASTSNILLRSLHSPKVLTECPIAVVLIFQTYKDLQQPALTDFYPLVMESIRIQPEPQRVAYLEAKERGETFVGVANGIANREIYTELIKAQVKTMAFLAYVLRGPQPTNKEYLEVFPEACVRLLRDCPPEDVSTRKELLVATRHILTADSRTSFIPYIDILLEDRVLVGTGITSRDGLRPLAYSVVADLIHHVRNELPLAQLSRIVYVFSCQLNDATYSSSIQTMCAKLLNTIIESIYSKGDAVEAGKIMKSMFFTSLEKLMAMTEAYDRLKELETAPGGPTETGWRLIEQAMPVFAVAYANESVDTWCKDARHLYKTLLHTFRSILTCSRQADQPTPPPDGEMLSKFFQHAMRCLLIFENSRDPRDAKEATELISQILLQTDPHVFSELWTNHMAFVLDLSTKSIHPHNVLQMLITHETVSHQLVGITLKFLMKHLSELGGADKLRAGMMVRMFKMSFLAINSFNTSNESVLVPHLQKFIMESFTLAAESDDPSIYYQILRSLFRSIGGGRFEALYKEVLPILQEMLDKLAYLLDHATTNAQRDLFVELTLTVPVRLTNLLPHLGYLMKPLVHALQAGPDQVSQGLRTLELCIDNLTADFLDPTMGLIVRDLMSALNRLLKPIPANRAHAQAAMKILGKLGGRNRRFQEVETKLDSHHSSLTVPTTLEGKGHRLRITPLIETALSGLDGEEAESRLQILIMATMGAQDQHAEDPSLQRALCGLFVACGVPALSEKASSYTRGFCRRVFALELGRTADLLPSAELGKTPRRLLLLTTALGDCFINTLADAANTARPELCDLLVHILTDCREMATRPEFSSLPDVERITDRMIMSIASRSVNLCHEEDWLQKMGGVAAIRTFVEKANLPRRLILDMEIDFVRALIYCLEDSPKDPHKSTSEVIDLIKLLIRTCHSGDDGKTRQNRLVETLLLQLNSQKELSRNAAQGCIATLAEVLGQGISEVIGPLAKIRVLDPNTGPIFSKPLRALPFPMQVGNIDAIVYLLDLEPSLIQPTEEFTRLLHEVLALADVDDAGLLSKPVTHGQENWLKKLRISCMRLLRSAMARPEHLGPSSPLRSRIIQVYFKHVYSHVPEVVDVAHDAMRDVLAQQNKLPKEVLQQGLRPILVNLADAKRLSVSGLDGLARFLELLNNYFKVEIGTKLLDHFVTLGDPQMLAKAAYTPIEDNTDIARMSRLVNVFRLLPASGVQYLKTLTGHVVDAEAALLQSSPGPFTENIAKYLDRYHVEGTANLFENLQNPRYIWTYRNIIASGHAPQLVETLSARADEICQLCLRDTEAPDTVIPALQLLQELAKTSPSWLVEHDAVLGGLVGVWRAILAKSRGTSDMSAVCWQEMPVLILDMFMMMLRFRRHVPLLFHVVEAFEVRSSFEKSHIAFFLYEQVALADSVEYRRDAIDHFSSLYEDERVTWAFKVNALRLVVTPTLRVYFSEPNDDSLVSTAFVQRTMMHMWRPYAHTSAAKARDDTLLIEIFAMTTVLVVYCPKMADWRKDAFRVAWMGINLLEPTVKLMAYVLTSRFIAKFETPPKFTRLCWVGLLRLKESEGRGLYRQAINNIAGCLPYRDPVTGPGTPEWAIRLRTTLVEEGQSASQLVTVCELLVGHPDLFYDYRELYVPQVAQSSHRLAFAPAATTEMKRLTVDAMELMFRWERRRMAARDEARGVEDTTVDSPVPSKKQRIDRAGTAASSTSGGGWAAPGPVRELMTANLMKLISTSSDPVARGGLTKRALDLFKEIIGPKGLPNVNIKMSFFQRTMTQEINETTINVMANSAEVIAAVAAYRDQGWIKANCGLLTRLLEKVWVYDDTGVHEAIQDLTERMMKEMPDDPNVEGESDGKYLYQFVQTSINDGLVASLRSHSHLPGTLFLLRSWRKAKPNHETPVEIGTALLKVLAHLIKLTPNGPEQIQRLITSILDITRDKLVDLKAQRQHLFGVLATLVDRAPSVTLCRYLLDLMRQWTVEDPEPALLGKEKAALLLKMASFEQRDEQLFQRYLEVIYDIYECDALRGTDITHRLEPAFLLGTKSTDAAQRARFLDKLEQSLPQSLDGRLQHLYSLQNWDTLSDGYWIPQILSMLLGLIDESESFLSAPLPKMFDGDLVSAMSAEATTGDFVHAARNLIHIDPMLAHRLWVEIFPLCWSSLTRVQQTSFTGYIVKLLSKEYHAKQVEMRPNVIQTFLDGILPCTPPVTLPPLLVKYLAKNFNAWYVGFEILTRLSDVYRPDNDLRDSCSSALSELYAELAEDDLFYGLARSRCVFPETAAALTYEQNGQWPKAIELYEQAQIKARTGNLPVSEEEYCFWEDHWILAAEKLQHWDSLTELARIDQDADLLLECAWRLSDWGSPDRAFVEENINRVADTPTPRRKTFEAYTALLKAHQNREPPNDFQRILDEAQQVTLRKWVTLPQHVTAAHLPLLQMFQQCVELTEAAQVFDSLSLTTSLNLEARVTNDLKQIFQTWRDRLPNFYDDIMVWSDLLAWRQHVFQAVTRVYVPLLPQGNENGGTYGYKGYHETAWMINRFGEVARRHGLLDVCSVALNRIYALPNIEISEAFLKLREQALCFFQKPDKFNDGLENISTTNLMYFAPNQKAEFLTLKGMFISKLGQNEEANTEFAHAIQTDMNQPKAWAEWGRFNDKLYRERPEYSLTGAPDPKPGEPKMSDDQWAMSYARDRALLASSAVSCYLQAAGLYNNHKSRGLFLRVLWLLGLDDTNNTIAKAFENFKGEPAIWYWITLVPQLLLSLSHREAKQARYILMRIGKLHPQATFYHLRVSKEDYVIVKKQQDHQARQIAAKRASELAKIAAATNPNGDASTDEVKNENGAPSVAIPPVVPKHTSQPLELVEELMSNLKTNFPLLALTMEKMVDQISLRAKPSSEEDIYRFFAALLADALQQWGARGVPNDDGDLSMMTRDNLAKFSHNLSGDLQAAIMKDFMEDTPKLRVYIKRLQYWRDAYEKSMDARPRTQPLDSGGCNLIEFHHTRFDDVEVPGQYAQHVDQTEEFIKIERFSPMAELGRGHGHCFRRITMIGSNSSKHSFNVQMPAARHCRREERLTQLFRIMNSILRKRKESRRRNLQFHLPVAIALAPQLRLQQNDSSYASLQDVYDDFASSRGMSRELSMMTYYDRIKQLYDPTIQKDDHRFIQLKSEIMEELQTKMVPETILTNYMIKHMATPESLWLMRKQFAVQTATLMFLTYVCALSNRAPSRFHFSRKTGLMYMTEMLPSFGQGTPVIQSNEAVPFRLTPNMQRFITRIGIEGILTAATTAIARSLTMPEFDLAGTLSMFIRDEVLTWISTYTKEAKHESHNIDGVNKNVELCIRRASMLGYIGENKDKNGAPALHAVVTLISQATSPMLLASMGENFMAWY